MKTVDRLVKEFDADVNAKTNAGNTPLMLAACFGKMDVIRVLVKKFRSSPHTRGQFGRRPLHHELMPTSLRAVLEQRALSRQQVVSISRDVASTLNYLHLMKPNPVLHRDISSANVLLEPSVTAYGWKAKVCDCGPANYQRQLSTVGPGNPAYTAPEANNPAGQSPKMDVFGYGVLLLEMEMPEGPEKRKLLEELEWTSMAGMVREGTRETPKHGCHLETISQLAMLLPYKIL